MIAFVASSRAGEQVADLHITSGLPINVDNKTGELQLGEDLLCDTVESRTLGDLVDVLAHRESVDDRETEIAYRVYRDVRAKADAPDVATSGLRYDLTVILPGTNGREFNKTAGHRHRPRRGEQAFPEVYDVLAGRAMFVLQWDAPLRLAIVQCGPGERVLIPGEAAHLSVNIGAEPLVIANLVAAVSKNEYDEFRAHHGAAIYLQQPEDGPAEVRQVINRSYPETPTWRTIEGSRIGSFAPQDRPLYSAMIASPGEFAYLTDPASVSDDIQALWVEHRPGG
jgi:glucose-6-phosphate isomerase